MCQILSRSSFWQLQVFLSLRLIAAAPSQHKRRVCLRFTSNECTPCWAKSQTIWVLRPSRCVSAYTTDGSFFFFYFGRWLREKTTWTTTSRSLTCPCSTSLKVSVSVTMLLSIGQMVGVRTCNHCVLCLCVQQCFPGCFFASCWVLSSCYWCWHSAASLLSLLASPPSSTSSWSCSTAPQLPTAPCWWVSLIRRDESRTRPAELRFIGSASETLARSLKYALQKLLLQQKCCIKILKMVIWYSTFSWREFWYKSAFWKRINVYKKN